MGTVSVKLYNQSNEFMQSAFARHMSTALADGTEDAKILVEQGDAEIIYLRDCLGGLRAEVRRNRHGNITVRKTS